jgi:hypothetical protein
MIRRRRSTDSSSDSCHLLSAYLPCHFFVALRAVRGYIQRCFDTIFSLSKVVLEALELEFEPWGNRESFQRVVKMELEDSRVGG